MKLQKKNVLKIISNKTNSNQKNRDQILKIKNMKGDEIEKNLFYKLF